MVLDIRKCSKFDARTRSMLEKKVLEVSLNGCPPPIAEESNVDPLYLLYYEETFFGLGGHYQSVRPRDYSKV